MATKKQSKQHALRKFVSSPLGHIVLAGLIWLIGFNLLILATDTGSLLQWTGVIVSLLWGLDHIIKALNTGIKKTLSKQRKLKKAR